MGSAFEKLDDTLIKFLCDQHLFFVATAPSGEEGHVNLSPKGYDTFRVLDEATVAYLDLTGSGVETIAHLRQNGRITLMFCAFSGPPRIVRLYGRGEGIQPEDEGFGELSGLFPAQPGVRAVIRVRLERVSTSCGYAVPRFSFEEEREGLTKWSEKKGVEGIERYKREKNGESIDGLPALKG